MASPAGVRSPFTYLEDFARDVRKGLSAAPKTLPSRYLYDAVGSALFDVITVLPEYGLSRADERVLLRAAPALAGRLVNQLRDLAIVVAKLPKVDRSPDPDDNHLLALAEAGEAQFLVTGDKQLLSLKRHKFTHIITPATLVDLLR